MPAGNPLPEIASKDDKRTPSTNVKPPPAAAGALAHRRADPVSLDALGQQIDALVPKEDKKDWTPITKTGESPKADIKVQLWREPSRSASTITASTSPCRCATPRTSARR